MTLLDAPINTATNAQAVITTSAFRMTSSVPAPLPDLIEPQFWTGTPWLSRADYVIDLAGRTVSDAELDAEGELATRIRATYDSVGIVLVTNTGLTDLASMRALVRLALTDEMEYGGGSNPRTRIEPNVYEVGAPLSAWLHYHHEMAYVAHSASAIGFLCKHALPAGRGRTFVSDSIAATDALLATPFGHKLRDLGLCYHRNLTDRNAFAGRAPTGVYNHWQRSFDTDDAAIAVERAEAMGLETQWGPNGLLHTRYHSPAFEYFASLDRNVLYSSVADHGMWFDTWPLVQHLPHDERPLDLTFGNGSRLSVDELQQFVDVYDRFGTPIDWNVGDVAVICNYRFAHGRPGIDLSDGEQRELGVVLGAQFDRVGVLDDRW
jgi:hypothetical protein